MKLPTIWQGHAKVQLVRLVCNGFSQAAATVASALLIKLTFDAFITTAEPESGRLLAWIALGFLITAIFSAWLRLTERTDAESLGQNTIHRLRLELFQHMNRIPPRILQARSRGSMMLRFVGDLGAIRQWISLGLARLLVAGITISTTLLALAFLNGLLALMVGAVLVLGAIISLALGKPMQAAVKEARRRRSYLAGNISEKINAMAVVQVCGQTRREQNRLARQSQRLKRAMISRARVSGKLRAVTEGTTMLATATALLLGAIVVGSGQATPGMVVAAMSIVGLLIPSMRDLGRVYEYWQGALVARQKIQQFLAIPTRNRLTDQTRRIKNGSGLLEFQRVSVKGSLQHFSGIAEPGSVVAVVGANGAGKSTLLALAARLLEPDQGTILLDGKRLAKLSPGSLRRGVGMVSADLPLLRGTIDKNLCYRWPKAPEVEIARVKTLCGIDDLLHEFPDGGRTRLTDGAMNLSHGQRQRIALARAVLGSPSLLLLDEADVNLDPASRKNLSKVIATYQGTVILVTHHLDMVKNADVIWHLQDGCMIETGTPDCLLNQDGPTTRLFQYIHALAS